MIALVSCLSNPPSASTSRGSEQSLSSSSINSGRMVISFSFHLPLLPFVSLTTYTKYFTPSALQLGAGLFLRGIALPEREHPTAEERVQLSEAIGESIAASWTLFQTTNTAQVLAVGQAQLSLIQRAHYTLYPSVRPMHYSAIYRLIGGALHFQGRYDEARQAHEKSYITALEGSDVWNMAQSLSWQADGLK